MQAAHLRRFYNFSARRSHFKAKLMQNFHPHLLQLFELSIRPAAVE
jgi:hypothetical protein